MHMLLSCVVITTAAASIAGNTRARMLSVLWNQGQFQHKLVELGKELWVHYLYKQKLVQLRLIRYKQN